MKEVSQRCPPHSFSSTCGRKLLVKLPRSCCGLTQWSQSDCACTRRVGLGSRPARRASLMISSAGRIASSYSRLKHARGLCPPLEAGVASHGGLGSSAADLMPGLVGLDAVEHGGGDRRGALTTAGRGRGGTMPSAGLPTAGRGRFGETGRHGGCGVGVAREAGADGERAAGRAAAAESAAAAVAAARPAGARVRVRVRFRVRFRVRIRAL